jgi:hypothetical protein
MEALMKNLHTFIALTVLGIGVVLMLKSHNDVGNMLVGAGLLGLNLTPQSQIKE